MNNIKKLFDLVESIGETLEGNLHIIDISEVRSFEEENATFRIYHSDGYCINITKEFIDLAEDESCENIDGYYYDFDSELFDGFKHIKVEDAIKLIKKYK